MRSALVSLFLAGIPFAVGTAWSSDSPKSTWHPSDGIHSARKAAALYQVELQPPAILETTGDNNVFTTVGILRPGSQETKSFVLPKLTEMKVLILGSDFAWSFRAPSGEFFVPGDSAGHVLHEFGSMALGLSGFIHEKPEQGNWTVWVASRADTTLQYGIIITADGPAEENAHLELRRPGYDPRLALVARPGDPVYVRTFVTKNGVVVTGTRWVVHARTTRDSSIWIPVFDDGKHADGRAGDGVFVGAIVAEGPDGHYQIGTEGRTPNNTQYMVAEHFEVQTKNDLLIADSIFVSPRNPKAGKPVVLRVTVMNDGTDDFKSVPLELYVDGNKLSEKRVDLRPGEPRQI